MKFTFDREPPRAHIVRIRPPLVYMLPAIVIAIGAVSLGIYGILSLVVDILRSL